MEIVLLVLILLAITGLLGPALEVAFKLLGMAAIALVFGFLLLVLVGAA